jgi:predicted Ser/Thr protein kinase
LYTHKYAGKTHLAYDLLSGQSVVIKLESTDNNYQTLEHEYHVYRKLSGGVGISHVQWFGTEYGFNAMAMDVLGHSLEDLFIQCHSRFTIKTVVLLAHQLVRA